MTRLTDREVAEYLLSCLGASHYDQVAVTVERLAPAVRELVETAVHDALRTPDFRLTLDHEHATAAPTLAALRRDVRARGGALGGL